MNTKIHGVQPTFMDRTVDPGVDFNRFANGAWIDAAMTRAMKLAQDCGIEVRVVSHGVPDHCLLDLVAPYA